MSALIDPTPTECLLRPRFEGLNIHAVIGFKHVMYLAEEALLEHVRQRSVGLGEMFLEHGLGVEIVDASIGLKAPVRIDDIVLAVVKTTKVLERGFRAEIELKIERDGKQVTAMTSRLQVVVVREKIIENPRPVPAELVPFVVEAVAEEPVWHEVDQNVEKHLLADVENGLVWTARVPYYYCHYSTRMQHSGYVRLLEEGVDRFLADRGLSISSVLADPGWIPAVTRARIRMTGEARIDDELYCVIRVDNVAKNVAFSFTLDCYVRRGNKLLHTAKSTITHGYVVANGPKAGELAHLDEDVVGALLGGVR